MFYFNKTDFEFNLPDPRWEEPNLLIPGKKPTGPVVVDRDHWAGKHCVSCLPLQVTTWDIAADVDWNLRDAAGSGAIKAGALDCGTYTDQYSIGVDRNRVFVPDTTTNNEMTILIILDIKNDPTSTDLQRPLVMLSGSTVNGITCYINAENFSGYNGRWRSYMMGSQVAQHPSAFELQLGRQVHAHRWKSGEANGHWHDIDGVRVGQTTGGTTDLVSGSYEYYWLGDNGSGASKPFDGTIEFFAIFNRGFTAEQTLELTRNPYQFLIPA